MHDDHQTVERRLDRSLNEWIRPAIHPTVVPLSLAVWHVAGEPVTVTDAMAAHFEPFVVGQEWGPAWSTSWFRASATVPTHWAGRRVEALLDLGFTGTLAGGQAEALVYGRDGQPIKGVAPGNSYIPIADACAGGEEVVLLIEAAANPDLVSRGFRPTGLGDRDTAGDRPLYRLAQADLAVFDEEVWQLSLDFEVLLDLMRELPAADPRKHELRADLAEAVHALDPANVDATVRAARRNLARSLGRPAAASAHRISAVGHAHIDVAWLWPQRETIRKTARTFANMLALTGQYPEFRFVASQALQYEWMKQHYPDIFAKLRDLVKAGQWVPVGGMWVESDANLPSGEALVRQLVFGTRFFLSEFGTECSGVWLPDTFGFSASFPQLAKLAGMRWFMTQKLSWNDTNRMPHHTFWWEGIDGSRLFAHCPPIDTYAATLSAAELAHASRTYAEKGLGTRSLAPFGYGDGGGGPTREMIERARRLADLEGSARVCIEGPDSFFEAAQAEYPDAPTWSGELYLEFHRGTYTSQLRTKAGNRRGEHLIHEAELWASMAAVQEGIDYPYDELERLWKILLVHQFHDILAGSAIAWVHREAEATYAELTENIESLITPRVAAIAGANEPGSSRTSTERPWVFNASPRPRTEVVCLPIARPSKPRRASAGGFVTVGAHEARLASPDQPPHPVQVTQHGLGNGLIRVRINDRGLVTSIYDLRADREVVAAGECANLLQLHPDLPGHWDGWDIDRSYRRRVVNLVRTAHIEVVEQTPLAAALRIARTTERSYIVQTVRLRAGSSRLDFVSEINWGEQEKILKAAFPLDVHADRTAAEIQFGHVYRPLHTNTSWDAARFELYAHRWIHVAEAGYGVGLLTDTTYGYDAARVTRPDGGTTTTIRLSLLRAPRFPDPQTDLGSHRLTYSLLPGASLAEVIAEGYAVNIPVRVVFGSHSAAPRPWLRVDEPAVILEAVKLADDRSGDVIARLYESLGGRAQATMEVPFPIVAAEVVDLLERPCPQNEALTVRPASSGLGVVVDLALRPFQVLTVRLRRDSTDRATGSAPEGHDIGTTEL